MLRTNSHSFKKKMRKHPINEVQKYSLVQRINEVGERVCIIMNLKNKQRYGRTNLRIGDKGLS